MVTSLKFSTYDRPVICRYIILGAWRWRYYVSLKCSYLPTSPHGATAQKTNMHRLISEVCYAFTEPTVT
jgi:hypothetical protein